MIHKKNRLLAHGSRSRLTSDECFDDYVQEISWRAKHPHSSRVEGDSGAALISISRRSRDFQDQKLLIVNTWYFLLINAPSLLRDTCNVLHVGLV